MTDIYLTISLSI